MKNMTENQELLAEYAANGSETAFRELVARYVNFVYSTARRLVGEQAHLAEDVTQVVFINLARKGRSLSRSVQLGGWLHQHTYHVATKAVRSERRRQSREREALEMNHLQDDSEANLRRVEPILDEAITQLGMADRTAILLRFFERRDFHTVGEALGSNEDAARMRVKRALEKLHVLLKHRGVALSITALATLLTAGSVTAAPAGLALAASRAALAGAAAGTAGKLTLIKLMTMTKLKTLITLKPITTALFLSAVVTALVVYRQSQSGPEGSTPSVKPQRAEPGADAKDSSSRLALAEATPPPGAPAVPRGAAPGEPPTAEGSEPSGLNALISSKTAKLNAAEVESYLNSHRRDATSLLAAFRTTDDPAFLEEAMQKYPQEPQVAFEALLRRDSTPAERSRWLDALKQSAPDNALPNYLAALDDFKAGHTQQALQELANASSKPQFADFSLERAQDDEEAYRDAGRSVGDAKLAATANLRLPHLADARELSRNIIDLANSYQQAGDEASRQTALQMAVNLGRRFGEGSAGESLISQLVGINVERTALQAMDPGSPLGDNHQTVQDRINQLVQQRAAIQALNQQAQPLWVNLSDQDWATYIDRSQVFGEQRALNWLVTKYGKK
ncbi:MAG TPA: sigma-70 family RNA polymerase sigma factor [Candidatus Acidoferrum sp.]|jgi:RNA polymerase sigma factor (sigma-70 family)|nr:sigma-70 family RNA polymerase sigma factor [Candidatus Acidoferrum sp.]